ncbi:MULTISPECIES: class A beta-lactamase [Vibrio]|uniref:class A beta-lactamase n=1 Tax=Vibrio TaxID=662 RepID=UPI0005873B4D|nr:MULTISPECIES: class A beta-lactamase [Vibrio]MDE3899210.1 class A beta-lactamase [Vibrio sp. CC007]NRF14936.1 class A beta-lactamase [Vibrio coralliilyticus]QFT35831.1 Beta-lactamase CARB-6 precursor [Vibrio sp. THAF64]QGM33731.1 Beta-lactamase CARB-6 precursor [Vibrio sp. THAF191d]QGN69234.1 Beta-lactamase CARB-6 precursor [Vibrio sp. THAF191c]
MKKNLLTLILFLFSTQVLADSLTKQIALIEQQSGGRLGVAVLDTQNHKQWQYHGDDRFPMMSTFKTLMCANALYLAEQKKLNLNATTKVKKSVLVTWSPITEKLIGQEITVQKACEATMLMSDNTAANIVLHQIGGPEQVTQFVRSLDDKVTRLDRFEPELNQATPGDKRDTTSPSAMVELLNTLLLQDGLNQESQQQLLTWMKNNKVSDPLIRSVLPQSWSIADRSGAGNQGSRGITALVWNSQRKPVILSIYLTQTQLDMAQRNRVINRVANLVFEQFSVK